MDENFDIEYQKIAEQIRELKVRKLEAVQERKQVENHTRRIEEMYGCLKRVSSEVREFDEDLIRRLLTKITVINQRRIEIHFKSGIIMEQTVDFDEA